MGFKRDRHPQVRRHVMDLHTELQRSALPIPAAVDEKQKRRYTKALIQYLSTAYESFSELELHLQLFQRSNDIGVLQVNHLLIKTAQMAKRLKSLKDSLDKNPANAGVDPGSPER